MAEGGRALFFEGMPGIRRGQKQNFILRYRTRDIRGPAFFCFAKAESAARHIPAALPIHKKAVCRPGAWRFGTSKSLTRRWLRQSERERPALDRRSGRGKPAACRKPPVLYRYSCRCKARDARKNSIPVTKERKLWSYKKISLSQAGKRGPGRPLRAFGNLTGEEAELQGSFRFSLHFCLT